MQIIARLIPTIAVAAALLALHATPSSAGSYGNAPWCAVQNLGAGEVVWDCEFPSAAACAPYVIAGNRGFCNINPRFSPSPPAMPRVRRHGHQHHHRG